VNLAKARDGLRTVLEAIVLFLMISLAVVVVAGVVFRKAGASLVWYDEVASLMLAWLTYYGAALAALHRGHIGMPTLVDRLSGAARRGVVLIGEVCVLAFFLVLAFSGMRVLAVLGGMTLVSLPWFPMAVAQSVIPIGAVLFIVAQLLSLPQALSGPQPKGPPPADALAGDAEMGDTADDGDIDRGDPDSEQCP
jgi:TRAP-type C4-dicarboxylate transport system permease small subunit